MKLRNIAGRFTAICAIAVLSGCATTPDVDAAVAASEELRDTNLDVMFATEFPVASQDEALLKANNAYRSGEVDKALFFYVRALQFNTENVELLALIGDIHLQRKDLARAKLAHSRALEVDPEYAASLEALGLIQLSEGNEADALTALAKATEIDDGRWRAHNALGVFLDRSGDYSAAQRHYDSALARNPGSGQVLNNRGYSKYLAGDFAGATLDLYTAASANGFDMAWGNLGLVYASQGMYDDAITAYREIMSDANVYNNVGQVAIDNGDLNLARYYLDEAIRLSPVYFPQAQRNLELIETLARQ